MAANADTVFNLGTLGEASHPIGSDSIADLARRASDLNQTIRDQATRPNLRKSLRTFQGPEVASLLDLKVETLYRRLERQPSLPQGAAPNPRRRDFTLEEIYELRRAFNFPLKRTPGQSGVILSICNFKGGVAKTTTAAHLAQYLVMHGYRVLLVDLDAQASLTQLFGILPHTEVGDDETVRTFLEGPNFPGRDPDAPWTGNLRSVVQPTHWHNLDLIPSNLGVYGSEFAIASRLRKEEGFAFHRPLSEGLAPLRQDYDVIILDTAPSLSFVNSNALFAADGLLITLPPAMIDLQSSTLFFELVSELVDSFNNAEETPKVFDFASILITRVKPKDDNHTFISKQIRQYFPKETCTHAMVQSTALEKVGPDLLTLYEVSDYDGDRRTLERAVDAMNDVNGEIERSFGARSTRAPRARQPCNPRPPCGPNRHEHQGEGTAGDSGSGVNRSGALQPPAERPALRPRQLGPIAEQASIYAEHVATRAKLYDQAKAAGKLLIELDPKKIRSSKFKNRNDRSLLASDPEFIELRESLRTGGQDSPIRVRPVTGALPYEFEIAYGHRRHAACLELDAHINGGFPILAIVDADLSDTRKFVLKMYRENADRSDLSAHEKGLMFVRWLDLNVYENQRDIAAAVGLGESAVAKYIAVAELPASVLSAFGDERSIPMSWGAALSQALKTNEAAVLKAAARMAERKPRADTRDDLQGARIGGGRQVPRHARHFSRGIRTHRRPHSPQGGFRS